MRVAVTVLGRVCLRPDLCRTRFSSARGDLFCLSITSEYLREMFPSLRAGAKICIFEQPGQGGLPAVSAVEPGSLGPCYRRTAFTLAQGRREPVSWVQGGSLPALVHVFVGRGAVGAGSPHVGF